MSPTSRTDPLFQRYYFSRPGFVDGTTEFHAMCSAELQGARRILEIGAGPSNATTRFLAGLGPVVGLDVSDEVRDNTAVTEAHVYDGRAFPFPDGSFDGCVSNYVLEHVDDARAHFREVHRVLRPGGAYVFRTPNLHHYVAAISRATPHSVHVLLSKWLRGMADDDHDPWPTHYHANTRGSIRAAAREAGLGIMELRMVEKEPSYARSSVALFYPCMAYERVMNAGRLGERFRANIFGVLRRSG